jgi:hypothetical protein
MGMHKAVARDALKKAGWGEPQIRMALRILAYDGARDARGVAPVIAAFAERSDDVTEAAVWRKAAEQLGADPRLAEALFTLRGF